MKFYTFSINGIALFVSTDLKKVFDKGLEKAKSLGDNKEEYPSYSTVSTKLRKETSYIKTLPLASLSDRRYQFSVAEML